MYTLPACLFYKYESQSKLLGEVSCSLEWKRILFRCFKLSSQNKVVDKHYMNRVTMFYQFDFKLFFFFFYTKGCLRMNSSLKCSSSLILREQIKLYLHVKKTILLWRWLRSTMCISVHLLACDLGHSFWWRTNPVSFGMVFDRAGCRRPGYDRRSSLVYWLCSMSLVCGGKN